MKNEQLSESLVVGVYQSPAMVQRAVSELIEEGYSADQIQIRSRNFNNDGITATDEKTYGLYGNVINDMRDFFHGMTDGDSRTEIVREYSKVLDGGNSIVAVDTDNDAEANKAASLMSKTAAVVSNHTSTSPRESDISDTGDRSGVKIFKGTSSSYYQGFRKGEGSDRHLGKRLHADERSDRIKATEAEALVATQSRDGLDRASDAIDRAGVKTRHAVDGMGDRIEAMDKKEAEAVNKEYKKAHDSWEKTSDNLKAKADNLADKAEAKADRMADRIDNAGDRLKTMDDREADAVNKEYRKNLDSWEKSGDRYTDDTRKVIRAEDDVDVAMIRDANTENATAQELRGDSRDMSDRIRDKADRMGDRMEASADRMADKAESHMRNAADRTDNMADRVADKTENMADKIADKTANALNKAADKIEDWKKS